MMEKQFTATVYILQEDKVLLIFHRKLKKWLPPGGHIDANETPPEAARREALEETGLEIELIPQENLWINRWNANSFERPYLCLLEEIPQVGNQAAHQHMDFIYIGRPKSSQLTQNHEETAGLHWFTVEEIESLKPDEEIYIETQQTIRHLLKTKRPIGELP